VLPNPAAAPPSNGVPANGGENDRISALRRLEEARLRPYYDEARDTEDAATYYGDLAPGPDRGLFFEQLHTLLESTHLRRPSYRPAVHLYPFVDLQPGDGPARVRSVYSGQTFLAEDFINEDFEIERARERFANELMAAGMESSRIDELNLLEATHPFNCEHVVPQSWFRKREPMRGDLHHLFACESGCNSFRGNIPYFDFPDFEEAIRSECGKRETGKFEPGAGKGEVARATLYFLLRYPGEAANTDAGLPKSRIATLLDWHSRFPVTLHEKHRGHF
jgi:endonuclease I